MVMFVWHLISIACALIWPALFCSFGSWALERMENIGHEAYESNWHDFPPALRKLIIVIIARSQEEISFGGLGLIGCSIEVFGNVSD